MVLATVPDAPPTRRNHRATSWPAPISAKEPNIVGSRFSESAFWCVPIFSVVDMARSVVQQTLPLHWAKKGETSGTSGSGTLQELAAKLGSRPFAAFSASVLRGCTGPRLQDHTLAFVPVHQHCHGFGELQVPHAAALFERWLRGEPFPIHRTFP